MSLDLSEVTFAIEAINSQMSQHRPTVFVCSYQFREDSVFKISRSSDKYQEFSRFLNTLFLQDRQSDDEGLHRFRS